MANSLTALSPEYWSKKIQEKLYKQDVFRKIAGMEERAVLRAGDTINKPYTSDFVVETYTKGTAMTAQNLTASNEALSIDQIKSGLMYIDEIDRIQNIYSAVDIWTKDAATKLSNTIDAQVLYETVNANDTIDDYDVSGGTSGNGITLAVSNICAFLGKINTKLDAQNVSRADRVGVISPQMNDVLWQYIQGKETLLGDRTGENGQIGHFAGFELYMSNNLTADATWTPANDPSDTQTITLKDSTMSTAITFTFVTTISTTAGNVLRGTSVAATIDNLVALINAGGVTSDVGVSNVSLSSANQKIVSNWVAVDNTTSITIRSKGGAYWTALTTSDAADIWTTATQYQHALFGERGAIDVVIQQEPKVDMGSALAAGLHGIYVSPYTLYGTKLFAKNALRIVDCLIRSDAY